MHSNSAKKSLEKLSGEAAKALLSFLNKENEGIVAPPPSFSNAILLDTIQQEISQFLFKIVHGMGILLETVVKLSSHHPHWFNQEIAQEIGRIGQENSLWQQDPLHYLTLLSQGNSLQSIFKISNTTIEALYQGAKWCYEEKKYLKASDAFAALSLLDPEQLIFWLALGNCEFQLHRYDTALAAYALATKADPLNPYPHLYSAACYEKLEDNELALNALDIALYSIKNQDHQLSLRQSIIHKKNLLMK